jgi:hypothetical protein
MLLPASFFQKQTLDIGWTILPLRSMRFTSAVRSAACSSRLNDNVAPGWRLAGRLSSQTAERLHREWKTAAAVGPQDREHAKQDDKPAKCEHYLGLTVDVAATSYADAERRLNSASYGGLRKSKEWPSARSDENLRGFTKLRSRLEAVSRHQLAQKAGFLRVSLVVPVALPQDIASRSAAVSMYS